MCGTSDTSGTIYCFSTRTRARVREALQRGPEVPQVPLVPHAVWKRTMRNKQPTTDWRFPFRLQDDPNFDVEQQGELFGSQVEDKPERVLKEIVEAARERREKRRRRRVA